MRSAILRKPIHVACVFAMAAAVVSLANPAQVQASPGDEAAHILDAAGVQGGLVVHLGCGDGRLTAALRANDSYLVQGLDLDPVQVDTARQHVRSLGLYGKVSIDRLAGKHLPYIDNLVNLVVADEATLGEAGISMAEVIRVLCPQGIAYVQRGDQWLKTVKPRPEEIDEWTHFMHDPSNNAVAQDDVIGPPRHLQWLGSPRFSRQHDHMSSTSAAVSSGGRVFYIFDEAPRLSIEIPPEWHLYARDAFNGTMLWKRPIDKWHTHLWPLKSGPAHLPRRLVAIGDTIYVTLGIDAPVSALDAASGHTLKTYQGTEATEEIVVSDGVLFLIVNPNPVKRYQPKAPYTNINEIKAEGNRRPLDEKPTLLTAVEADTGKILWQEKTVVLPLTLAVDGERVYFHDGDTLRALDRGTGKPAWASTPIPRCRNIIAHFAPTLVVYQDVVLFAGGEKYIPHRGGQDTMTAVSAATGETLWTAEHPPGGYQSPEDLLVSGGLVWSGATTSGSYSGVFTGRDPKTGKVVNEFPPDVSTYWFHHRCYRAKATEKYLLTSRTGIEFLDPKTQKWEIHHWVRGACLYGIMPCNGMIYSPPHPCACYPEAKLYGFNALAPTSPSRRQLPVVADDARLEKGPAYRAGGSPKSGDTAADDWPTYRGDNARSGRSATAVPARLKPAWTSTPGGRLSPPVIADGKVFLAKIDEHAVCALDAESGEPLWSYTVGGRVDSPPTIYQGRVLFGAADGWVYCLRADDGQLAWRFFAAPCDRRHMYFEQIESVWPVPGNILVEGGVATFVSGRSVYLDGGMKLYRLDALSGHKLSETVLDDRDPETGDNLQARLQILNMPVGLSDILSCDGKHVYMRSQVFDLEGRRGELGPHSGNPAAQGSVQRGETAHLFCPSGFLDDSMWHRTYWVYGRSFAGGHAGYFQAGKFTPAGRIMVFDDVNVYGFGRKPQYYRWTTPLEHQLFAADKQPPEVAVASLRKSNARYVRVENTKSLNPAGKPWTVEAWVQADRDDGVVVARGGPAQGYALVLRKGRPRFVVRIDEKIYSVTAKKKVVGRWVCLTGVITPKKRIELYVDGKLAAAGPVPNFIGAEPKQPMEIGSDEVGAVGDYKSPFGLNGVVDEIRLFDGSLSAEEIAERAKDPAREAPEGTKLVLSLSFEEGKAQDASGLENHGQVAGIRPAGGRLGSGMRFLARRPSGGSAVQHLWTQDVPLITRGMVLAGNTLFLVGPPDVVDEQEAYERIGDPEIQKRLAAQSAALHGKLGGVLLSARAKDGETLSVQKLGYLPVWDGLAAAGGRLFLATTDGKVVCLKGAD